ncbi:MAG: zinc-dependent alcohol dehydrogenase family protein [Verrucomicrobiales bacterium]
MKAWHITSHGSFDGLAPVESEDPMPGPRQILVRVRAVSLNYRDLTALRTQRPGNLSPLIPCSDAAGVVIAVGAEVTRFRPDDRVAGCFFQAWPAGSITRGVMKTALGGPVHGVLSERALFAEDAAVPLPPHLSFQEAATLPCAGLTAWHALVEKGCLRAGTSVLLLGTGGVSIFALQFAKLHGARVIITSSNDEKLARAQKLGADVTINYRTTPDWEKTVWELTGNEGVDHVIEVGGAGTLARSLAAVRFGGRISLIGVLTGFEGHINPWPIVARSVTAQGIYVGSTEMFDRMNAAIAATRLRPVIDRIFAFADSREAFAQLESGNHFGKIVIAI